MRDLKTNFVFTKKHFILPNAWDVLAFVLVISVIVLLGWGAKQMAAPYKLGDTLPISLEPSYLPTYALQSVLRMFVAMLFSLLFTFTVGTWAAKSKRAERLLIPLIDILQSVPVIGYLSITIAGFIALFPNSLLGPECACLFAIFTAQVWNMVLSFYQSLKSLPADLKEAAKMFHLSSWQRFWRIEVPFSVPGLLWNAMISMSASWFFVVAAEAISVSHQTISLPGIGSYIAVAIKQSNLQAVVYAILAMFIVILIYDQLLFRPLVQWAEKFHSDSTPREKAAKSLFISLLQRTQLLRYLGDGFSRFSEAFINFPLFNRPASHKYNERKRHLRQYFNVIGNFITIAIIGGGLFLLGRFIFHSVPFTETAYVMLLGVYTSTRVIILIIIASFIWIPIGVWVGFRPRVAAIVQPIAQFLASFPANLLFPLFVILIVKYQLNVNIWTTPLMILGTQWYILFNVIAGANAIPKDLVQVTKNFNVTGWLRWKRFILPGIFPYFITGAITAAGGAWNASIVAEVVSWGNTTLEANGLGAYISKYTTAGDFPRVALGIAIMCLFVLLLNHVVWRPLYVIATSRFQIE